jgi:hypothetical protein
LTVESFGPLPLSTRFRDDAIRERTERLGASIAVALVQPLADVLGERYAQPLVEPVAGRPGYQDLIRGESPAAGSSYRYTVPGQHVLYPLSVMCRLATDATVADRALTVEYQDADGVRYCVAGAPVTLAASQTQSFCWQPQAGGVAWPVEDVAISPLPQTMIYPAHSLVIKLSNGGPADQLDRVRLAVALYPTEPRRLELPRNSGEVAAVNGPTTLEPGDGANE